MADDPLERGQPRRGGFISRQNFRTETVRIIHAEGTRDEVVHEEVAHVQERSAFFDVQAPVAEGDVVEVHDPRGGPEARERRLVASVSANTRAPRMVQHLQVTWGSAPAPPVVPDVPGVPGISGISGVSSATAVPTVLAAPGLAAGHRLLSGPPPVADYLSLRRDAGLSPKTEAQAVLALSGSWFACHVVDDEAPAVVGMGRVVGDGGWCFHIVDLAVLPSHQRRGIGDAVLTALLDEIRRRAPDGAYVNLLADAPGRRLYERHGFVETAPASLGMALT